MQLQSTLLHKRHMLNLQLNIYYYSNEIVKQHEFQMMELDMWNDNGAVLPHASLYPPTALAGMFCRIVIGRQLIW